MVLRRFTALKKYSHPRVNAVITTSMGMILRAKAPSPTYQQICDLAYDMAKAQLPRQDYWMLEIIHFPTFCYPPEGLVPFMSWGKEMKEMAGAILQAQMDALPRPKIKRRKKRRIPRRFHWWTGRRPFNFHPPPRKRGYLPPVYPVGAGPPRRLRETVPAQGLPLMPDREILLCYTWLFDIKIVVPIQGTALDVALLTVRGTNPHGQKSIFTLVQASVVK